MSEQEQKKKSGRPIGGIKQHNPYATFGRSKQPDSQITSDADALPSTNLDSQISSNSNSQALQYLESQKAELPDSQSTGMQNKQIVSYLKEKKPERKAQIAYLPPALIKRLKRYAVENDREISEVVADAVEQFLDRAEER